MCNTHTHTHTHTHIYIYRERENEFSDFTPYKLLNFANLIIFFVVCS